MGKYYEKRPHSFGKVYVPRGFAKAGYHSEIQGIHYFKVQIGKKTYGCEFKGLKDGPNDGQTGSFKFTDLGTSGQRGRKGLAT